MIFCGRFYNRVYMVSISLSGLQSFQEYCAAALSSHITIGSLIEGFTFTIAAQHSSRAKGNVPGRTYHDLCTTYDRHITASRVNRLYSSMQGDQRAGTSRINGCTGSMQIE